MNTLKIILIILSVGAFVLTMLFSGSSIQETAGVAIACYFAILARLCQAEKQ